MTAFTKMILLLAVAVTCNVAVYVMGGTDFASWVAGLTLGTVGTWTYVVWYVTRSQGND